MIYNGTELDITIYISDDKKSSEGGYGKIESYFTLNKENKQINISPIKITIYRDAFLGSNNTGKLTLANEFGDVIFMTTRPEKSYVEQRLNYYQRASTRFSFDYEHYIDKPLENNVYDEISPLLYRIHSQQKEITNQIDNYVQSSKYLL